MHNERIDRLHAAGILSDLDRSFARLVARLSGARDGSVELAAALASRASAEGNICLDLAGLSGGSLAAGQDPVGLPGLQRWVSALKSSPVVGAPGDWRPLVLDGNRLYLFRHWDAERSLACFLLERAQVQAAGVDIPILREGIDRLFPGRSAETDWQRVAGALAILKPLCVITGGPGTGKTTTVARILALLIEQPRGESLRVALAAPTGKAAARMQEAIREAAGRLACGEKVRATLAGMEASTLHRLLGSRFVSSALGRDEDEPLPFDAVVVDEASMVPLHLLSALARALPPGGRLILLGDRDQLASVEAGAVLGDICGPDRERRYSPALAERISQVTGEASEGLSGQRAQAPVGDCIVELARNYRFGNTSGIGSISRAIRSGDAGEALLLLAGEGLEDLGWKPLSGPRDLARALAPAVVAGYGDYLHEGAPAAVFERFSRFRILCALRDGPYGVNSLNAAVEGILARAGIIRPGRLWYEGRPVMVTRNDYGLRLFNGDTGIALADPGSGGGLRVFFPSADGAMRTFEPYRLPDHETVFAMTVHKSQGTEFDQVLFILPDGDARVLTRELLYTGVTRARKRVDLWAGAEALRAALSRRIERASGLREALWGA